VQVANSLVYYSRRFVLLDNSNPMTRFSAKATRACKEHSLSQTELIALETRSAQALLAFGDLSSIRVPDEDLKIHGVVGPMV
jgi:hypothetical protein